ncbi:MAG: trigger factor [Patescibacteria group bacterium]|nr:trigger factor [Patescibacteria group bacterium]
MKTQNKSQGISKNKASFTVARSDNGNIQITFTFPKEEVKKAQEEALKEIGQSITVPGFRKGKAPFEKVKAHVPQQKLVEKVLTILLPETLYKAISTNKIKPAIYPKFELIKTKEDEDWEIRAITAEIPEFSLDNYKEKLVGEIRSKKLVKSDKKLQNEITKDQKQEVLLRTLVDVVEVNIPPLMIKEELDSRLAQLLQRIEKLGLTLENYLNAIGKNPETLRQEYERDVRDSIALDAILTKIAEKENIEVSQEELEKALEVASSDPQIKKQLKSQAQVNFVKTVLIKRKVLDHLTSLWDSV